MKSIRARGPVLIACVALAATSCSLVGGDDDGGEGGADTVVLVTHDSFSLPDDVVAAFEEETGYQLDIRKSGDGGSLANELVLTKDEPLGDVAFGVDNTYASVPLGEGVFEPHAFDLPAGAEEYLLPRDDEHALTPVDTASVCVNVDTAWFAREGLTPPDTLDDLVAPTYEDLFVTPAATTSTPGMAFLLATIAEYGEAWPGYWSDLMANGAAITKGWEDAYNVDFTFSGGDRPIVLSYDSSPAFTVEGGESTTKALLETCFRQVEYAGLLAGAENPAGGRELLEFLVSEEVQAALPESMYVFPVVDDVELPEEWARFAEQPDRTLQVEPELIAENRAEWLREWRDVTSR